MAALSVASWGLFIGGLGLSLAYGSLIPALPHWIGVGLSIPPWLVIFSISFCNVPPFGPRVFRRCLLFALCWYAAAAILAEAVSLGRSGASAESHLIAAWAMVCFGTLSFVPIARAYRALSMIEEAEQ